VELPIREPQAQVHTPSVHRPATRADPSGSGAPHRHHAPRGPRGAHAPPPPRPPL